MKIDDIEAFVTMVRCQSISQAARELGLTQPAITRRLQNLEEDLGAQLLDRQTKPPRLTDLGWRVHEQCQGILRQVDALHDLTAADLPPHGNIRLGVTQGLGEVVALEVYRVLQASWPDLTPMIATSGGGQALLDRVERDELDAAILFLSHGVQPPRGLSERLLAASHLVVVGEKGGWPAKRYGLAACNERGWVLNPDGCGFRAGLKRALATQNLPLRVNLDSYGRDLQFRCISEGMGLGLMPYQLLASSAWRDKLDIVPVTDFKPRLNLWMVLSSQMKGRLGEPARQFGDIVEQAFK